MSNTATIEAIVPVGVWSADAVHSSLTFELTFAGVNTFRGGFRDFSATVTGGDLATIEGSAAVASVDPFGRERLGLRLETTFDRTQFGVSWNAPNQGGGDYLGNDVKVVAELALVKQED